MHIRASTPKRNDETGSMPNTSHDVHPSFVTATSAKKTRHSQLPYLNEPTSGENRSVSCSLSLKKAGKVTKQSSLSSDTFFASAENFSQRCETTIRAIAIHIHTLGQSYQWAYTITSAKNAPKERIVPIARKSALRAAYTWRCSNKERGVSGAPDLIY